MTDPGAWARVDSHALATAANNALAFLPAASTMVKVARLVVSSEGVEFTATDGYAAGRDSCPVDDFEGEPVSMLVDRACLQGLDGTGRKDKKGSGVLKATPGDGVVFTPMDKELTPEAHLDVSSMHASAWEAYAAIDECLDTEQEFRTAFQPQLLMRFSKVKADKSERVADLAIDDPEAPVLVKIGTTFRGLIMPVDRAIHAENVGEEGLW